MSLRETLSNVITFTVINEYAKGAAVEIESEVQPVNHGSCRGILSNATF